MFCQRLPVLLAAWNLTSQWPTTSVPSVAGGGQQAEEKHYCLQVPILQLPQSFRSDPEGFCLCLESSAFEMEHLRTEVVHLKVPDTEDIQWRKGYCLSGFREASG